MLTIQNKALHVLIQTYIISSVQNVWLSAYVFCNHFLFKILVMLFNKLFKLVDKITCILIH